MAATLALALPLLAACGSIGSGAGAVVGLATGAGSANPVVGTVAGLGTKAAVDTLVRYIARKQQQGEQDAIAVQVGSLPAGASAPWKIEHTLGFGNEHGEVQVVRLIPNALAPCKEVVFTVRDEAEVAYYATSACLQETTWKWAQAEPATTRWGYLQ